jgi:hypothetical protein
VLQKFHLKSHIRQKAISESKDQFDQYEITNVTEQIVPHLNSMPAKDRHLHTLASIFSFFTEGSYLDTKAFSLTPDELLDSLEEYMAGRRGGKEAFLEQIHHLVYPPVKDSNSKGELFDIDETKGDLADIRNLELQLSAFSYDLSSDPYDKPRNAAGKSKQSKQSADEAEEKPKFIPPTGPINSSADPILFDRFEYLREETLFYIPFYQTHLDLLEFVRSINGLLAKQTDFLYFHFEPRVLNFLLGLLEKTLNYQETLEKVPEILQRTVVHRQIRGVYKRTAYQVMK